MAKEPTKPPVAAPDLAALQARATELRKDIDSLFDEQDRKLVAESPGVPEVMLRQLLRKCRACHCA